jgi:hypothetical protein
MKRRLIAAIVAVLIVAAPVFAFMPDEWMGYSATKTADALIHTGAGYFYGVFVQTDGTNSVTFAVYDALSKTGTPILLDIICTSSSTNRMCAFGFDPPIPFSTGLFIDIASSDSDPDYTVFYRSQ